jgi:hypothetical protein
VELGNIVAKNHGSDVDKRSHSRLLTLTYGSWHIAGFHQPVVNGGPPKITGPIWTFKADSTLLSPIKTEGLDFLCSVSL